MSKKRTAIESSNDEQTNEDSGLLHQQEDNAKSAKLDSLSDTTLQDLPNELLVSILAKAVAMEVLGMKLSRSVWKEKAGIVMDRLRNVSSRCSRILETDYFQNEVHKILDGTAPKTIRFEMLYQSHFPFISKVMTTKDEILLLCSLNSNQPDHYVIKIYDRDNMAEVKDVIPLQPGIGKADIAVCSVSNCIYVLYENKDCLSVAQMMRDGKHRFNMSSPLITDLRKSLTTLSVSPNGDIIIHSKQLEASAAMVRIYDANGSLLHEIVSPDFPPRRHGQTVFLKSTGNLVALSIDAQYQLTFVEFDVTGRTVRQYQSLMYMESAVNFADSDDRIVVAHLDNVVELMDSEFNLLEFNGPSQQPFDDFDVLHYNRERNEVVAIYENYYRDDDSVLTIFRFIEE